MRLATSMPQLPHQPTLQKAPHGIAARLLAATLGSYLLCFSMIAALQLLLPAPLQAVLTLLPFIICAGAVLWAFRARDIRQAWIAILVPAALCGAVVLLQG